MKSLKAVLLGALIFTVSFNVQSQTIDEIIAKHIEAIGGKDKLNGIKTAVIESSVSAMGADMEAKTTIMNGKAYRNEIEVNGSQIVQVFTEKGGWEINPFTGGTTPTPVSEDINKASLDQANLAGPLFDYASKGGKVELLGKEKVGDAEAWKIKYLNKDNVESTFFIDANTHYNIQTIRKGNAMGQEVTITINYSNFQKTDYGIVMPFSTNVDMQQIAMAMTTKKIEFNKEVDPAIFDMPK